MIKLLSALLCAMLLVSGVSVETPGDLTTPVVLESTLTAEDVVTQAVNGLTELAADSDYTHLIAFGVGSQVLSIIDGFAALKGKTPEKITRLVTKDEVFQLFQMLEEIPKLSDIALRQVEKRLCSASFVASITGAAQDPTTMAAVSIINYGCVLDGDLPSGLYLAQYDEKPGIAVGIWNDGAGHLCVSACFVPDAADALQFCETFRTEAVLFCCPQSVV